MPYTKHLPEEQWERISASLPGKSGDVGVMAQAEDMGAEVVLPSQSNRKKARHLDKVFIKNAI